MQTRDTVEGLYNSFHLRTSLCKNQTFWEMKIFNPLQILHAVRHSGGMHKNQIVCISSRFRVLRLLSWEFEQSEVL